MSDYDPEDYIILVIKKERLEREPRLKYIPHIIVQSCKGHIQTLKDKLFGSHYQGETKELLEFFSSFFGMSRESPAAPKNEDPFYLLR